MQDHPTRVGCRVVPDDGSALPEPAPEETESDMGPPPLRHPSWLMVLTIAFG